MLEFRRKLRMRVEDLRSLSQIGQALWVDPVLSRQRTAETLQAVGLLQLADERIIERASSALLARARSERELIAPALLSDPFFRLMPEERLLLVALHQERWSYRRIARVMNWPEEEVATRAWRLRVHLASQRVDPRKPLASLGAAGAPTRRASCPEFDPLNPWTQRFFDEEHAPRERLFIQNHLMACDDCRSALGRCRDLYYLVESMIPRAPEDDSANTAQLQRLQSEFLKVRGLVRSEISWRQALGSYLRRIESQLLIAGVLTWIAWKLLT
jgi:hypothetical protein